MYAGYLDLVKRLVAMTNAREGCNGAISNHAYMQTHNPIAVEFEV
jgi:hypothetical protein